MKRKYQCSACGHVYDPAEGDPAAGVPPGTAFDCGATKSEFQPMEE